MSQSYRIRMQVQQISEFDLSLLRKQELAAPVRNKSCVQVATVRPSVFVPFFALQFLFLGAQAFAGDSFSLRIPYLVETPSIKTGTNRASRALPNYNTYRRSTPNPRPSLLFLKKKLSGLTKILPQGPVEVTKRDSLTALIALSSIKKNQETGHAGKVMFQFHHQLSLYGSREPKPSSSYCIKA